MSVIEYYRAFAPVWYRLPIDLFHGLTSSSNLPVYELNRFDVVRPRGRVRPLIDRGFQLPISAWRLAHAIKKADYSRNVPSIILHTGSIGFLMEHLYIFDWTTNNLRLRNDMAKLYVDISRTSLSARVAQGMTILFMENKRYSYGGRFSTFLKSARGLSAATQRRSTHQMGTNNPKTPDFIFENGAVEVALAESKGGFLTPNARSDIKGDLDDALNQLRGWDRALAPQPAKSFAVGTYLREKNDPFNEPSLIAFVDPESEEPSGPGQYQPDLIRRLNYGSWLAGMGFHDAANRLQGLGEEGQSTGKFLFPTFDLGPARYAFVSLAFWFGNEEPTFTDGSKWVDFAGLPCWPPYFLCEGFTLEVMGIRLDTLKALSIYLTTGQTEPLMNVEPSFNSELPDKMDGVEFHGSIYSDGTLLGELRILSSNQKVVKWEEVSL